MLEIPVENHILEASRQVEGMCHFTSKPFESLSYFCSAKTPKMTDFRPKKCTVSLWERQFATLCLFHAYTDTPPRKKSRKLPQPSPASWGTGPNTVSESTGFRHRTQRVFWLELDSVKRHLRGRHLSVLNLKFDFISDGGCTREEQIALSLKRHLFPHGGREPKAFWICFSQVHPPSEIKSNFKFKTLKRHLLKRHLTLSDWGSPMHWDMGFSLPLAQKSKIQKIRKSKMQTFFDFSMPVSSRYKTQKNNISGLAILRIRQTRVFETRYKLRKADFLIFRFRASSIFRLTEVSEFSKPTERAKHQSIGDTQFLALTEFRGESSVSSLFVCQSELTEFAAELSEFSLPNSTLEKVFRPFPISFVFWGARKGVVLCKGRVSAF